MHEQILAARDIHFFHIGPYYVVLLTLSDATVKRMKTQVSTYSPLRIFRDIDNPHSAFTELVKNAVTGNRLPDHKREFLWFRDVGGTFDEADEVANESCRSE